MALEQKMSKAEAKQDAKLMAGFFRRFSRAEQVIDMAIACENEITELRGTTAKLRDEIKGLQTAKLDAVNDMEISVSSHKVAKDKLGSDYNEYKSTLETKMEKYAEKVAGEVKEIKDSLAAKQREHDSAMKNMEKERDGMRREVDAVRAEAEALQKRASGLV